MYLIIIICMYMHLNIFQYIYIYEKILKHTLNILK